LAGADAISAANAAVAAAEMSNFRMIYLPRVCQTYMLQVVLAVTWLHDIGIVFTPVKVSKIYVLATENL
jgi:hypothetical protein